MKNDEYRKESISCYVFCLLFLLCFIGFILLCAEMSGNSLVSSFPRFSWDMMMKWQDIVEIFDLK
ncbi:hypothetical protein CN378_11905 [Bacillus sp. AFS015802]|uniref:hypothetical protein n=1 Tax=Bacillus sp. AFS015802 TaxID=2033486 RepID=UPI000BF36FBE|nr:hypothetical protein [Bacillus sp. AFS015802]PFA67075.1 hypothetical protein CN378_11905 [Bacillus sp. AFS015802]